MRWAGELGAFVRTKISGLFFKQLFSSESLGVHTCLLTPGVGTLSAGWQFQSLVVDARARNRGTAEARSSFKASKSKEGPVAVSPSRRSVFAL